MTLAALASFAGKHPDVTIVLALVDELCRSAPMPNALPSRENEWLWWNVPTVLGHRVSVAFGRGRENGIEMSRVKITLGSSVPVPDAYRAEGSLIDVKAFMDGDRAQLIGVVSYAASVHHDESSCRGGVEDEPTLPVGHRFRIDSAGRHQADRLHGRRASRGRSLRPHLQLWFARPRVRLRAAEGAGSHRGGGSLRRARAPHPSGRLSRSSLSVLS
jgi:hypothetical protein